MKPRALMSLSALAKFPRLPIDPRQACWSRALL
jgi:hypothetical protein